MAETTHPTARTSAKPKGESFLETLNPLNVKPLEKGLHRIGTEAKGVGEVLTEPGRAGEEAGHKINEAAGSVLSGIGGSIAEGIGALIGAFGIRLLEVLAGAGLVLFGLVQLGKAGQGIA